MALNGDLMLPPPRFLFEEPSYCPLESSAAEAFIVLARRHEPYIKAAHSPNLQPERPQPNGNPEQLSA